MSRIDEAMKRASHGHHVGRAATRTNDSSLRLAEEFTLNEYPLESRGAARADVMTQEPRIAHEVRPVNVPPVNAPLHTENAPPCMLADLESQAKLVIGALRNVVSTEQYRRLAAALHDSQVEKGLKTVMITSAVPREGKTLTVVNLGLTLSESYGRRVLLIDADLRRPSIHEVLKVPNERGLSDVLGSSRGELPLIQMSQRLWVLPAGRAEHSPLAGLSSGRMHTILEEVSSRFDWVLIDTPPVGLLSDAQVLGRLVRAAVFVIRAGVTPFAAVEKAMADLGRDCIIGTVLNDVDPSALPTTTYYGHYYR
jgi:capsular exopolysaccharide synthesis family protein